jgi:hypothetical protein
MMIDRLADLRPPHDEDEEEEDEEEEGRGGDGEVEGLHKFETDLRQLMDGILDLKRRGNLPDRERTICMKLLLRMTLKQNIFDERQLAQAQEWLTMLEGTRRRGPRLDTYNEAEMAGEIRSSKASSSKAARGGRGGRGRGRGGTAGRGTPAASTVATRKRMSRKGFGSDDDDQDEEDDDFSDDGKTCDEVSSQLTRELMTPCSFLSGCAVAPKKRSRKSVAAAVVSDDPVIQFDMGDNYSGEQAFTHSLSFDLMQPNLI